MYKYTIYDLTDRNFDQYKKEFEKHIIEDIEKTIAPFIGLHANFSFDLNSEYFKGLKMCWKIARGDEEYMIEGDERKLVNLKERVEALISKNENAKINGTILPRSYVFQPLTRKYLFDNVADYAMIMAEVRLSAMLDNFLSITEARLLGGFKQRESIVREIQNDSIRWSLGADGNYKIKGLDFVNILKERDRWYWSDMYERIATS